MRRWKDKRRQQLNLHPLCTSCLMQGRTCLATVADHIEPHKGDYLKFWQGALQSLCRACHESYKKRFENSGIEQGCDPTGEPFDKKHHWK